MKRKTLSPWILLLIICLVLLLALAVWVITSNRSIFHLKLHQPEEEIVQMAFVTAEATYNQYDIESISEITTVAVVPDEEIPSVVSAVRRWWLHGSTPPIMTLAEQNLMITYRDGSYELVGVIQIAYFDKDNRCLYSDNLGPYSLDFEALWERYCGSGETHLSDRHKQ